MAKLYKRKPGGPWWYQFKGKRRSTKLTDKHAAELYFAGIQRRAADPLYRAPNETTVAAALKAHRAHKQSRSRSEGTLRMYDAHYGHMNRLLGAHTPLSAVTAPEIDGYLTARHAEGASRETQWKELCTLRGALKLARRHGTYPHALEVVLPQEFDHPYKPRDNSLTLPQISRLLVQLPHHRAAFTAFIVAFAADLRSVTLAEPGDVTPKEALIRGTKNPARWRRIPVLKPFEALARRAAAGIPFTPWLNVQRDLKAACEAAKIPQVTPRDLRRSHAKILRALGAPPHLIGLMLGHKDSKMVERVYGRLSPEALGQLLRQHTGRWAPRAGTPKVHKQAKTGT